LDPLEAASRILKGTVRQIDIAKVNAKNKLYYSFNIIGWGLVTDAGYLAEKLRWLGGMRYDVAAILEVLMGKRRIAQLLMDNEVIEDDFVFIIACNTIHTGKAMRIAPRARLDDGKIDLVIVRKSSKIKLLKLFPKLFSGEHIKSPLVEYRQVEKFSVIPKEDSSLNIDGELIGNTPIDVTMQPKMIEVLV
jgi:diacylglycerol kinase family enzyme